MNTPYLEVFYVEDDIKAIFTRKAGPGHIGFPASPYQDAFLQHAFLISDPPSIVIMVSHYSA